MESPKEKKQNTRKVDEKRDLDSGPDATPEEREWDPERHKKKTQLSDEEKLESLKNVRKPEDTEESNKKNKKNEK